MLAVVVMPIAQNKQAARIWQCNSQVYEIHTAELLLLFGKKSLARTQNDFDLIFKTECPGLRLDHGTPAQPNQMQTAFGTPCHAPYGCWTCWCARRCQLYITRWRFLVQA